MAAYYLTASRPEGKVICLAPLTDRQIAACGEELSDTSGHFLYERDGHDLSSVKILAQVVGDEAVEAFRVLLDLS